MRFGNLGASGKPEKKCCGASAREVGHNEQA